MPFILPLATALTVALTYRTCKGTYKVMKKREKRKQGNGS